MGDSSHDRLPIKRIPVRLNSDLSKIIKYIEKKIIYDKCENNNTSFGSISMTSSIKKINHDLKDDLDDNSLERECEKNIA